MSISHHIFLYSLWVSLLALPRCPPGCLRSPPHRRSSAVGSTVGLISISSAVRCGRWMEVWMEIWMDTVWIFSLFQFQLCWGNYGNLFAILQDSKGEMVHTWPVLCRCYAGALRFQRVFRSQAPVISRGPDIPHRQTA